MNELVINSKSTIQRKLRLDTYLNQNVLAGEQFVCPFSNQCHESHSGNFYDGQLHHVGNHYDVSISGHQFRVMVVGQEYGHGPSHVSMEDRSQMVVEQTGIQKTFSNRNPHMRGTTSVLRLLFGIPLGSDHTEEYLNSTDDHKFHLFDAFSLANYLLCSAISAGEGRRGKSTAIMRKNCLVHFKKTIEILEPNVIIVQGKSFWTSIQNAFDNIHKITDTLFRAEINQHKAMIAVFAHPSTPDNAHNWGRDARTTYLFLTVAPTIELIRQEILAVLAPREERIMPTISDTSTKQLHPQKDNPPYDSIFEQIIAGLIERFPPEVMHHKPEFEHSQPNRMRIYIDRDRIKGSHYEICFRGGYYEFALHFESSPAKSLERRQAFDPHLQELADQVGQFIKSGPLEKKGWMRVWYERKHEHIDQEKIKLYIDQYSRFVAATFPILAKLYS